MAIKTNKETGRPNISYKFKYLESMKKYNALMEVKLGLSPEAPKSDDTKEIEKPKPLVKEHKKEVVEAPKELEAAAQSLPKSSGDTPIIEGNEANQNDTSKKSPDELDIFQDEEKPKVNPDDYEFRCSSCNELFNSKGNISREGFVRCPDCKKEYKND